PGLCYHALSCLRFLMAFSPPLLTNPIIPIGRGDAATSISTMFGTPPPGGGVMNAPSAGLEAATIRQQCKVLHLPTVAAQCAQLAEQAVRERRTQLGYLEALLQAELEDREQRLVERHLREK